MGSGRRSAPRSQAAAPALRGQRQSRAAGTSAKCGKRRPYSMCPVTAPRRGAEWQMKDPITSHVTGKDRDRHPNLLRRGTAQLLLLCLTPTGSGCRGSLRGRHTAPRSRRQRGSGPATLPAPLGRPTASRAPLSSLPSALPHPVPRCGRGTGRAGAPPPHGLVWGSAWGRRHSRLHARPPPGRSLTGVAGQHTGARRCGASLIP